MQEYLNIGSSPSRADCVQVGSEDYARRARLECQIYADQLAKQFPDGDFRVKSFPHDFGTYYEVVAWYNDEGDDPALEAALAAEGTDDDWTEESKVALRKAGLP